MEEGRPICERLASRELWPPATPRLRAQSATTGALARAQNPFIGGFVGPLELTLSSILCLSRWAVGAAIAWSLLSGSALAGTTTVHRCIGANGKVTLSDRRCPEDDAQAKPQKADPAKPGTSAAQATETQLDAKQCEELKTKIDERRKGPQASDAQRKSLRQSEAEHQRRCAG